MKTYIVTHFGGKIGVEIGVNNGIGRLDLP